MLTACAGVPSPLTRADRVAAFDKTELACIDDAACAEEQGREKHSERWWLCGYGWRPAKAEGAEVGIEDPEYVCEVGESENQHCRSPREHSL